MRRHHQLVKLTSSGGHEDIPPPRHGGGPTEWIRHPYKNPGMKTPTHDPPPQDMGAVLLNGLDTLKSLLN